MALGDGAGINNPRRTKTRVPCEVLTCIFNGVGYCDTPELIKINKNHRCTNFTKREKKK